MVGMEMFGKTYEHDIGFYGLGQGLNRNMIRNVLEAG